MTELLERINYDLPGLKKAKMCYAQGDADGAMDAVIEHFRTRTTPKYLFTAKEMEQCKVDGILEDAQETLDHYIYGHKFDGEIDWFFNPTEHTSHDNEWTWSLYRHIYWQPLARAYALTKDEKYTKEFLHEMTEWGKAWPVAPFMENEEDAAAKYKFPGHSWRTIETAMRIYTVWLPCMEAFRTSPAWDREGWVTFLTLLCDHADFLMTHYSNHKKSSNWLTMESGTLLECGILFPEIKSDWFMTGYRRVMQEVKYSFDNDGIHMERTPIYHMVAAGVYFQCYRLCKLNGIPVPPYMEPTLEKSAQFIMSLVKPDLSTPMIGDADRDDLTTRRCDTSLYEGMNLTFDPYDLNEMRAYFRTWYEETGREDFRFMATAGKEGTPPAQRNYKYIPAGIYVMRTGWGPEDSYFHVHGIQLERGEVSSHSHNDTGHVEIHARGATFTTAPVGKIGATTSCPPRLTTRSMWMTTRWVPCPVLPAPAVCAPICMPLRKTSSISLSIFPITAMTSWMTRCSTAAALCACPMMSMSLRIASPASAGKNMTSACITILRLVIWMEKTASLTIPPKRDAGIR